MTYTETDLVATIESLTGRDLAALTQPQRDQFDQFHSGGSEAVDRLLPEPSPLTWTVGSRHRVRAGRAGAPGRPQPGCLVVGVDIARTYVDTARALTRAAGLDDQVSFVWSDIGSLDRDDFDAAYTMHVQMNVADKRAFFTEIARRLRPGARMATFEVCRTGDTEPTLPLPWSLDGSDSHLATSDELLDTIAASGFEPLEWIDETQWVLRWFEDLGKRIAAGGNAVTLPALLNDGPTRMMNFAVALATGLVSVHRGSFILPT